MGASATLRDITEQKRAQRELAASEERFRTLASDVPVGIFEADASGINLFANQALVDITGIPAVLMRGRGWWNHVHPLDRERVVREWESAVTAGSGSNNSSNYKSEFRIVTAEGLVRIVEATARGLRDAYGAVKGFLGSYTDLTERREAEQAPAGIRTPTPDCPDAAAQPSAGPASGHSRHPGGGTLPFGQRRDGGGGRLV